LDSAGPESLRQLDVEVGISLSVATSLQNSLSYLESVVET